MQEDCETEEDCEAVCSRQEQVQLVQVVGSGMTSSSHDMHAGHQHESAGRKRPKTVSFAGDVLFEKERMIAQGSLSDFFVLMLLMALALLAPVGQEIAHVNDIILLYVGYSAITFLCQSPYSPFSALMPEKSARRKRSNCR